MRRKQFKKMQNCLLKYAHKLYKNLNPIRFKKDLESHDVEAVGKSKNMKIKTLNLNLFE